MPREIPILGLAIPARAGASTLASLGRSGGPRRAAPPPRLTAIAVILAIAALAALLGWVLVRGAGPLEAGGSPSPTATFCRPTDCGSAPVYAARQLPREWRWTPPTYDFESMYRE